MPKINKNSWTKFNKGKTRKLMIRIANPEELDDLDGGAKVAGTSISAMGGAYSAPNIYIEMSMGQNKGFLANSVNTLADQLSVLVGGARLDKLKAVTEINDSREEIDLIEQRIVAKGNLSIDDRDADKNYEIKKKYLIQEMKKLI